jgi:GT2 family glycosyltransferase
LEAIAGVPGKRTIPARAFRAAPPADNVPNPPLAVVLLNYDGLDDTLLCLESLRSATYGDLRVYLIDNGSAHGECGILAERYQDVTVIGNPSNMGFGWACNQGADAALEEGADYILFLNNDTVVDPAMLQEMVGAMERDKNIALCGPRVLNAAPPHRIQCVGYQYSNWTGVPHVIGKEAPSGAPVDCRKISWIMGCALLASKEFWSRSGGFSPDFFLYWEDVYLSWRARELGYSLKIADSAFVYHRKNVGSEFSRRHVYHMFYGQVKFSMKTAAWYQWPTLIAGLSIVAVGLVLWAYRRGNTNVSLVLLEAVHDAFRNDVKRHVQM